MRVEGPWGVREIFKMKVTFEWTLEGTQEFTWC